MEKLNKYFLLEIRELLDNHIKSIESNRPNTKFEMRNYSVNSSSRSTVALSPKPVMVVNNYAGDGIQIGITIPRF